ncbi:hypothetical protein ACFL24_00490 [Patescibacteria group bacterium]
MKRITILVMAVVFITASFSSLTNAMYVDDEALEKWIVYSNRHNQDDYLSCEFEKEDGDEIKISAHPFGESECAKSKKLEELLDQGESLVIVGEMKWNKVWKYARCTLTPDQVRINKTDIPSLDGVVQPFQIIWIRISGDDVTKFTGIFGEEGEIPDNINFYILLR